MKKIILLLLFVPFIGFSQEKIDTYKNPLADSSYDISVSNLNKKGIFEYWFECKSVDASSKQSVIFIESDKVEEFKNYIIYLKDIHKKWSETAKTNNVTELVKDVDYKNVIVKGAFSYGDWNFFRGTYLKASFKIINGGHYIVLKNSFKLQSSSNQFIKSDGFMFSFEKPEDFDDLIEKLNNDLSIKILSDKKSKEDLFKS